MRASIRHLTLLALLLGLSLSSFAQAQSKLPPCRGTDISKWTNCFGAESLSNGDTYVGDFKDGRYHGKGRKTYYADDKVIEGKFENGKYVDDKTQNNKSKYVENWVINPQFNYVRSFTEGLAAVETADEKWGFIDVKGNFVIKPKFHSVSSFSEGIAAVLVGDFSSGYWGFIDKQGKFIIEPKFTGINLRHKDSALFENTIFAFSEGLAAVSIGRGKNQKWGFIDKKGVFVIQPKFEEADYFSEGVAPIRMGPLGSDTWGLINKNGDFVNNPRYGWIQPMSEGLSVFLPKKGNHDENKYGFMNKNGEIVIQPQFDRVKDFSEGLAGVCLRPKSKDADDACGYIDRTGKFKINPIFTFADSFYLGIAMVGGTTSNKLAGFITKDGNTVTDEYFEQLMNSYNYSEGLKVKSAGDKYGFVKLIRSNK